MRARCRRSTSCARSRWTSGPSSAGTCAWNPGSPGSSAQPSCGMSRRSESVGGSSSSQAVAMASCPHPRNQPSPRKSVPPEVSTRTRVPAPSGAVAAMRQAERVTELSRSRMATRSRGRTSGSVSPAMRFWGVAVTCGKVAPCGGAATVASDSVGRTPTFPPRGLDASMPLDVKLRRLAGPLALIALACGTGTITGPGGSTGGPPGSTNHPPEVTVPPTPGGNPISEGGTTLFSVTATDPDGDSLGYAWTQTSPATPQGSFSSRTIRNPVWTAPAVAADTVFAFEVTVTDGQGGSTSGTCQVTVTHTVVNRPPVVSASIAVSPAAPVAGEVVTLSITASDPDGDPLTITWVQTSPVTQGTFGSPTTTTTTWVSPPFGVDSVDFSIQVTVSDGHNPSTTR